MPNRAPPRRAYLDACVLISYLGKDADRLADIEGVLDRAAKGEIEAVTSVLTVVEVAFVAAEKQEAALDGAAEQTIDALWFPASPVKLVEFHEGTARQARAFKRLAMAQKWKLRTPDAIHLATAQLSGVADFFTYNTDDFAKFGPHVPFTISEPTGGQLPLVAEEQRAEAPEET